MSETISIQSADQQALSAVLEHHAQLTRDLDERVCALRTAVAEPTAYEQPLSELAAFLANSVLPHAAAEERTLYPAAAGNLATGLLVQAMLLEHRELEKRTRVLASARTAVDALGWAAGIAALFSVHVRKENELLLPALAQAPDISLAALLRHMEEQLAKPAHGSHGELGRPAEELDVRHLAHGDRHEIIFATLDALTAGTQLVIVNDHDPKPLRYQLDAAWPNTFDWDYLETGPQTWRIAVTRLA